MARRSWVLFELDEVFWDIDQYDEWGITAADYEILHAFNLADMYWSVRSGVLENDDDKARQESLPEKVDLGDIIELVEVQGYRLVSQTCLERHAGRSKDERPTDAWQEGEFDGRMHSFKIRIHGDPGTDFLGNDAWEYSEEFDCFMLIQTPRNGEVPESSLRPDEWEHGIEGLEGEDDLVGPTTDLRPDQTDHGLTRLLEEVSKVKDLIKEMPARLARDSGSAQQIPAGLTSPPEIQNWTPTPENIRDLLLRAGVVADLPYYKIPDVAKLLKVLNKRGAEWTIRNKWCAKRLIKCKLVDGHYQIPLEGVLEAIRLAKEKRR